LVVHIFQCSQSTAFACAQYFHNWTGNRVTCRDWFQLTLKEGLTVFRDQEFSGDMNSKAVNRIENVRALRARQFAEDAGPMSHPIRPESYVVRWRDSRRQASPCVLSLRALLTTVLTQHPPCAFVRRWIISTQPYVAPQTATVYPSMTTYPPAHTCCLFVGSTDRLQ
jgi:Peptidase family M1 domain